jgi:transposase
LVSVIRKVSISLSEYQREQLIRWVSSPGTPTRVVRRSRILLQLASGCTVQRASQILHISEPIIRLWRDRFRVGGLDALTTDAPRPGRPRHARDQATALVSARLAVLPPDASVSVRALARETGLGRHLVQGVLLDLGVQTDRRRIPPALDPAAHHAP